MHIAPTRYKRAHFDQECQKVLYENLEEKVVSLQCVSEYKYLGQSLITSSHVNRGVKTLFKKLLVE